MKRIKESGHFYREKKKKREDEDKVMRNSLRRMLEKNDTSKGEPESVNETQLENAVQLPSSSKGDEARENSDNNDQRNK